MNGYPDGCTQAMHDEAWGDGDPRGNREDWDIQQAEAKLDAELANQNEVMTAKIEHEARKRLLRAAKLLKGDLEAIANKVERMRLVIDEYEELKRKGKVTVVQTTVISS